MFGGAAVPVTPGDSSSSARYAYARITGLTLAARVGAPDPAAADTGQFTTGTPGVNQTQAPAQFGKGAGNWVAGDENTVEVVVNTPEDDITAGSIAYASDISVVGGDLVITVHNRGAGATGSLDIRLRMND